MELLTIRGIKDKTLTCLKENMAWAISLTFVFLFSLYLVNIVDKIILSVMALSGVNGDFTTRFITTLISMVLCLTFTIPIWINIKKWYVEIEDDYPGRLATLSMMGSVKTYFMTVAYGTAKFMIVWLLVAVTFIPAIIMGALTRFMWSEGMVNALYGVVLILTIIFVVISLCYAIYILMSTFFADYLYIAGIATNPFKAISLSFKISRRNRAKVVTMFITLIPWFLLSFLIVPLLFTVPYINTALALFAKEEIKAHCITTNSDCD